MSGGYIVKRTSEESLVTRQMDGELLIYDTRSQQVTALNVLAASVWRACDGQLGVDAIASRLRAEGLATASDAAVSATIEQLSVAGLVEGDMPTVKATGRREAMRKMLTGGMIAASGAAVVSLVAPLPAHAASVMCTIDDDCAAYNLNWCINYECF